jgi:hypothetical protein
VSDTPNVENPNEAASETEGDDVDYLPIGEESLELGEVEQWLEALHEDS